MKTQRLDDYYKHGCSFSGKLVVVNYFEDMEKDTRWGTFNANLTYEYLEKARKLVQEKGYNVSRELLSIPEYVAELK